MVILRLIKVLGGRIERLQDGKDRGKGVQGGRKNAQRRESSLPRFSNTTRVEK